MARQDERTTTSAHAEPTDDVEWLAAQHRLACYRKYAHDLPADGGVATISSTVARARARREERARPAAPRPTTLCEVHFIELSASGSCALCE